ncbi:TRAP transporter small permease [Corticicoccus populi]|uniref:TRAP transporter small permease n=1 Tax=Corticicoccus populi TaxID=1812821 RepID=A0ABW5WRW8_9STAP
MKILARVENTFITVAIIASTSVLFINIILRYFFDANTTWADEFVRYSMIWIAFIGMAVCFRHDIHFGVDLFIDSVSKQMKKYTKLYINLACILFTGLLVYFGFKLVIFSYQTGQITPSLQIKTFWVYLAIPIGALLSIIHLVVNTKKLFNDKNIEPEVEEMK